MSPISGPSSSNSYDSIYPLYHAFKKNPFPDLPPHLAPNQPKYYGNVQTFMHPNPSTLHYIQSQPQTQIPNISSTTLLAGNRSIITTPTYQPQQMFTQNPEVSRGRPIKILPSNNYQSIAPGQHEEAMRQQRMNYMLDEQISIMMTSPKSPRGRPYKGKETEPERLERLRKMAQSRKMKRDNETPDQRQARLKDLADRARKRRESMLVGETAEERRDRLSKQAEYARQRRLNSQTPQAIRMAEQKAKTLYARLKKADGTF